MVSIKTSAQEVTMLLKLIAAAKDSWACLNPLTLKIIDCLTNCNVYDIQAGLFHSILFVIKLGLERKGDWDGDRVKEGPQ